MSADNVFGWEIVLKISHLPSKLRFSAKCSFFGQSLSRGHYQPTYQPPEGVYLLNILVSFGEMDPWPWSMNTLSGTITSSTRYQDATPLYLAFFYSKKTEIFRQIWAQKAASRIIDFLDDGSQQTISLGAVIEKEANLRYLVNHVSNRLKGTGMRYN